MIIGNKLLKICLISLTMLCCVNMAMAKSFKLDDLYAEFPKKNFTKTSFVSKQYLNFSKKVIVSSGYLVYRAPDYFAQIIYRPKKRKLIASRGRLAIIENGKVISNVSQSASPNIMVLTYTLREVLSGRIQNLNRLFNITLYGKKSAWTLNLYPKRTIGNIQTLQIGGQINKIKQLVVRYRNGNSLVIYIGGR